jgi:hypothetical protein
VYRIARAVTWLEGGHTATETMLGRHMMIPRPADWPAREQRQVSPMPMTGPRSVRTLTLMACLAATMATSAVAQPAVLSVVSARPRGEVVSLAETNEVRIVFSEPMVSLGRIPETVTAPFFTISPTVRGQPLRREFQTLALRAVTPESARIDWHIDGHVRAVHPRRCP